ncbi:MAG: phosphoenolpyruvate carboxykinase (GTP) [Thermodesulfobacteriota bacterium]|nr:phosphoenolpyruvate carboxykinase (GTP) [Thermodesulfobacteriota bacterium]
MEAKRIQGEISTREEAILFLENKMDEDNISKIREIKTENAVLKIANAVNMCDPDSIFINNGSQEDKLFIKESSLKNGEEAPLAMKDHTIHYDLKEEQGRIVDRTFYIAEPDEEISSLANRFDRKEAIEDITRKMTGIMKGMTMIIGFYMRGPIGSPVANPAIEMSSSFYVSHSAELLYRNCFSEFDREVKRLGYFYTNIHSQGKNRPEDLANARIYMDRNYQTTYSMNCTYAGNTLLLKKGNHRFSVDRAVYENRGNELCEHMFITGIEGPNARITWFAGAAPSGCGKTTTAMVGNHFIGDDLAQMWIDENGVVRSINPESGIFGIVEDVNWEGDPKLMELLRKPGTEVIWSNVLVDSDGVPHWNGNGEESTLEGKNFQGQWKKGMVDGNGKKIPISHPNARVTLVAKALANYSERSEDPQGIETSVITYSGRDSDTMPPVWIAKNSDYGVVIGASIVSAATATEVGVTGVKRAPWANAPFIPGALGDYMDAQFKFFGNEKITPDKQPIMAGLNYFLTHASRGGESNKLLGEKKDVKVWLGWLERRFHKEVGAIETPIGYLPLYADLKVIFKSIIDKEYEKGLYIKQFSLYVDNILDRIALQQNAYSKEKNIPARLFEILDEQKNELLALKEKKGTIITPDDLL